MKSLSKRAARRERLKSTIDPSVGGDPPVGHPPNCLDKLVGVQTTALRMRAFVEFMVDARES